MFDTTSTRIYFSAEDIMRQMVKVKQQYVRVPTRLLLDPEVTAKGKTIYAMLAHLSFQGRYRVATYARALAEAAGIHKRTVYQVLKSLKKAGWIDKSIENNMLLVQVYTQLSEDVTQHRLVLLLPKFLDVAIQKGYYMPWEYERLAEYAQKDESEIVRYVMTDPTARSLQKQYIELLGDPFLVLVHFARVVRGEEEPQAIPLPPTRLSGTYMYETGTYFFDIYSGKKKVTVSRDAAGKETAIVEFPDGTTKKVLIHPSSREWDTDTKKYIPLPAGAKKPKGKGSGMKENTPM